MRWTPGGMGAMRVAVALALVCFLACVTEEGLPPQPVPSGESESPPQETAPAPEPVPEPAPEPDACNTEPAQPPPVHPGEGGTLQPAWEYRPPQGYVVALNPFAGIVDKEGNLFWIETSQRSPGMAGVTADLVSVNREGQQRFRVQVAASDRAIHASVTPLLAPGLVIVVAGLVDEACGNGARAEARDAADGRLVWSRPLGPLVVEASGERMCFNSIPGSAALAGDRLVVTARACSPTRCDNALIALALSSGEHLWTRTTVSGRNGPDEGLVVDERGNIFVSTRAALSEGGYGEAALLSLSPEGAPRFQVPFQEYFRVAAVGSGRVFVMTGGGSSSPTQVFDADSGVRVRSWDAWQGAPVITHCEVFTLQGFSITAQRLQRRDATWGEPSWEVLLAEPLSSYGKAGTHISWPILTRHGSLLFTKQEWSVHDSSEDERPAFLHEVDKAGAEVLRVALPRGRYHGASALRRGRWGVAATVDGSPVVRAFDLPDRDAADVGWASERGGMARDGRAR